MASSGTERKGTGERVGLFGGTFNPIHNCHLSIAAAVQKRERLLRIGFIPSGTPPHKVVRSLPPPEARLEMVRRAISGRPDFVLIDLEARRPGPSYTVKTLRTLSKNSPADFFFILGIDAFLKIEAWKEAEALLRLTGMIVISRPGYLFRDAARIQFLGKRARAPLLRLDSKESDREEIIPAGKRPIVFLSLPPCLISSREIRRKIRAGREVKNLLPESVASYIIDSDFYRRKKTGLEGKSAPRRLDRPREKG